VEVQCERCGTGYALDESRLGTAGGRVRCARCGHVFVVQRPGAEAPAPAPARPAAADGLRREWRVRRRDKSISSLRELTTLQRWIVEGKLSREDEVGLDGQNWRPLGSIPDLGAFFAAADALARVATLEAELARVGAAAAPPPVEAPSPPAPTEAPRVLETPPATPSPVPAAPTPAAPQEAILPPRRAPPRLSPSGEEPAFTRSSAGLAVVPTDDWEPPRLRRGMGAWLVLLLLVLGLAAAGALAYFYIWLPEAQRAREEQARTSQLQREQAEHEAKLKAAEQRAKEELLQSLAAAAARDAGPALPGDAGPPPQGLLQAPEPATAQEVTPALPASALPPHGTTQAKAAPTPPLRKTYEDWMAEATRRRTHERISSALEAYDEALALQPQSAEAHTGRGLALRDAGRRHEALLEFHRALELDPRDGVAVLGLAETYRSLGRVEEARAAYQRYLEGWPGTSEAGTARAALERLKE